jgi:translation initiation factor IF-3
MLSRTCRPALRACERSRRAYAIWAPSAPPTPAEAAAAALKAERAANAGAPPRDEAIRLPLVQLVHPDTKALLPPVPPAALLAALNRDTHWLELVQRAPPIVRRVDKKAAYAAARAQHKAKAPPMRTAELQLTWHVAPGDLATKLRKARAELEGGARVDLVFALKPRAPPAPPAKRAALLDAWAQGVAVEAKPRTEERQHTIVHLERDPALPLRATLADIVAKPAE